MFTSGYAFLVSYGMEALEDTNQFKYSGLTRLPTTLGMALEMLIQGESGSGHGLPKNFDNERK